MVRVSCAECLRSPAANRHRRNPAGTGGRVPGRRILGLGVGWCVMSLLKPADAALHYQDGSHRWVGPDPDSDQGAWLQRMRAHVERHATLPDKGYTTSRLRWPTQPRQRLGPPR